MNTAKSGQQPETVTGNKTMPLPGTQRRNNMMLGDAIVKKTKPEEEPDKVRANGGYNGFKTAKDLLKIDFTDIKSESSDSTPKKEHKAPPAKGFPNRRNSFGYGKTMGGAYEDPELYLRKNRDLDMNPYTMGANPYRYGHYPPGPYGGFNQYDPYSYGQPMHSHMSGMYYPPPSIPYLDPYYNRSSMGMGYPGDIHSSMHDYYGRGGYQSYRPGSTAPPMYSQPIGPSPYDPYARSTPFPPQSRQSFGYPPPMYSQPVGPQFPPYDPYRSFQRPPYQPPPYQSSYNPLNTGFQSSMSQFPPSYHQSMHNRGMYGGPGVPGGPGGPQDDLSGLDSASVAHQRIMNDEIRRLEEKQTMILSAMKQRELQKSQMFAPRMNQSQMFNPLPPNPYYGGGQNIYDTPQPPSTYQTQSYMSQPTGFQQPNYQQPNPQQSMMMQRNQATPLPPSYHQSQIDTQPGMPPQQQIQQPNLSPQPERPKSQNVFMSRNFKPPMISQEPDQITKANGGYNGFNTAKDLLAMNFKDSESEISDSTIKSNQQQRPMPMMGRGGPRGSYQPNLMPIQEPMPQDQAMNQPRPMFSSGPLLPGSFEGRNDPYGQPSPTPYQNTNFNNRSFAQPQKF